MARYHNADWLREKYWGERMSTGDIAEVCDVHRSTIVRAMDREGVETRDMSDYDPMEYTKAAHRAKQTLPRLDTTINGYERIRHRGKEVKHHRLAAVAWFGFGAVAGNHVHHENKIQWDNRESNLRAMDPTEHHREHSEDRRDAKTGRFV